jgi:hypothetical protein
MLNSFYDVMVHDYKIVNGHLRFKIKHPTDEVPNSFRGSGVSSPDISLHKSKPLLLLKDRILKYRACQTLPPPHCVLKPKL